MGSGASNYVLRCGDAGAERLRLLDRVKWPTTEALLHRAGLQPGMRCLDVGCGIGEVTLRLAAWVGPTGAAVGLDRDPHFLDTARAEAERRGLPAVFCLGNASELPDAGRFDLAYARFLLTHVPDPGRVLREVLRGMRPGGVVVVEDIDFPGHFSHPPCAAFDRYVALYQEVVRRRGGDPAIGPRLPALLRDAGLRDVQVDLVQPVFECGEGKRVAEITLEHIRTAVVDAGLATDEEVSESVEVLSRFAADAATLLSLPRIFQAWGRVPEG